MPTTLLDGETWDQAYQRRFAEEAATDAKAECQHEEIQIWRFTDGKPVGFWSCAACRTKFVPITQLMDVEAERDRYKDVAEAHSGAFQECIKLREQRDELLAAAVQALDAINSAHWQFPMSKLDLSRRCLEAAIAKAKP